MSSSLLFFTVVVYWIGETLGGAANAKTKNPAAVKKDAEWFTQTVLKFMQAGDVGSWKALFHPEVIVQYNMIRFPTANFFGSFETYEYSDCNVLFVHAKGPRSIVARWKCDYKDKQTGDSFALDVTDEMDFDPSDRVRILNRKFPGSVVEKFRTFQHPEKDEL